MIIHRVNTGCLYTEHGQRLTIILSDDRTAGVFFDHDRGLDGYVTDEGLGSGVLAVGAVVIKYVKNDIEYIEDAPEQLFGGKQKWEIARDTDHDFEDISQVYTQWIRSGFWWENTKVKK